MKRGKIESWFALTQKFSVVQLNFSTGFLLAKPLQSWTPSFNVLQSKLLLHCAE